VFYAAIAGVCLFISGLISGYYDNYAAYNRIPERILQLGWPRRLFGETHAAGGCLHRRQPRRARRQPVFGFLLGGTTLFGLLVGLPIDIRHVAFSSAFVGIAFVGLDFTPDPWLFAWAVLGVAVIGFMNLAVSFALALNVALRSRQVSESQWKILGAIGVAHLRRHQGIFSCRRRRPTDGLAGRRGARENCQPAGLRAGLSDSP
jgi:site-specific recombinase